MTSPTSRSLASRLSAERAKPFRLRAAPPHVHGYAWRHPAPAAALVLVHGLQSHALWFAEAGELLVDRGLSVYAVDRRGSGSSGGERGHVDGYEEWLEEIAEAVRLAQTESDAPVHLVGHCFGANVALGCALTQPVEVASLVMLTPGLHVIPDYSLGEKVRIGLHGLLGSRARFRVPQHEDLFSRNPDVVAWIRRDTLGARTLTAPTLLQINSLLRYLRRNAGRLSVPLLVLEAAHDRISDNARNRARIERALPGRSRWVTFDAEHFLLAEPCRDAVLDEIARWAAGREGR